MKKISAAMLFLFLYVMVASAQQLIIPQVADGGGWQTTIAITNTSATIGSASISFFIDIDGGFTQVWNLSFLEGISPQSIVVQPGSTLFLHTPGTGSVSSQGWAAISGTPGVVAYALFTQRVPGRQDQDGTAPAGTGASRFLMPFDNTSGFVTTMAVVNPSGATQSISVAFRATSGTITQAAMSTIPAGGHLAFALPQQFPVTSGQSGLAEFYSTTGTFSIIALRFNPAGAFTTAPVYSQTGPPIISTGSAPQPLDLTGTWSGTASDSTGPGSMTWRLTQTGASVSGAMTGATPQGTVVFSGNFSGNITGTTLTFTINVPNGGISRLPGCSIVINGSSTSLTTSRITGIYTGNNSCIGPFSNGLFSLTKQ